MNDDARAVSQVIGLKLRMAGEVDALVVLGETHGQKENLKFLNEAIPALHARAGVSCIAMEVFMAEENELIRDLVTAVSFDDEAAMDLARRMDVWGVWGSKGYWEVLRTVWRVNRAIPAGEPKLRVVGIGLPVERSIQRKHAVPFLRLDAAVAAVQRFDPVQLGGGVRAPIHRTATRGN